jgi:hypothetical protein
MKSRHHLLDNFLIFSAENTISNRVPFKKPQLCIQVYQNRKVNLYAVKYMKTCKTPLDDVAKSVEFYIPV